MNQHQYPVPPLAGYLDRLSARPGERIALKTSSDQPGRIQAQLLRIWHADFNPDSIGLQTAAVPNIDLGSFNASYKKIALGSWGYVAVEDLFTDSKINLSLRVQPWLVRDSASTLVAIATPAGQMLWSLRITLAGLELHQGATKVLSLPMPPEKKKWYSVSLSLDMRTGDTRLSMTRLDQNQTVLANGVMHWSAPVAVGVYFAAEPFEQDMLGHFNGRLEEIALRAESEHGPIRALWDFSLAMQGSSILDAGPHGYHGKLINLPTRAVRGSRWDGTEQCFRHAPKHYAAVHFHEDDLYDSQWDTDLEFQIPTDLPSGVYGVKIQQGAAQDIIPFYVLPPQGKTTARVCYLASTYTYMAYGNHARGNLDSAMQQRMQQWGTPAGPDSYPGFGFSTYNFHPDGSGFCFSSRLRPLLTMRPGFLTFAIHEGSGLRHFPADSHLVEWFRQKDIAIDVITDEDLHHEGIGLIEGYDVVITGSHPEYHTTETLDALKAYTRQGGNFVYLGGNGFYWRIAVSEGMPGVLEVRRTEGGIRAWAAEPGEGYQVFDGQYGGLWRRNGRPPQEVGGVGFSAQGFFEGSYYKRTQLSYDEKYAWIFDGVQEDKLGDYGFSGGGAAGFELDRADVALGSPQNTAVLARSEGHGASFIVVPEEVLSHFATISGEPPRDLVRAEIVYAQLPGGGQIFATGSITFCGSLPSNNFDNGVSSMLENVVRRFGRLS